MQKKPNQNQNKVFIVGFVLIFFLAAWTLARPAILRLAQKGDDSEEKANQEILNAPLITADDLFTKIQNKEKIFVVDMRSADDFGKGHLAASLNVAAGDLNKQKLQPLGMDSGAEIILLNKGEDVLETARKTNELVAAGFKNAKYLQGGIIDWMGRGYVLVSSGAGQIDSGKIKKISIEQLGNDLSGGDLVQFIDLREQADFQTGHIPGALNLPLAGLERDQSKISPLKKVVVYGKDDQDAAQAAVALFDFNFFNVYVLDGGLDAWRAADGKVEI